MTRDDLFRGLLAAIREKDVQYIDTRNDAQHAAFRRVVKVLTENGDQYPEVPRSFVPSPFTGRYRELDDALLRLQRGLLGAQNPFYPGVNLKITKGRAQRILDSYTEKQRELFSRLASVYLAPESVIEHAT